MVTDMALRQIAETAEAALPVDATDYEEAGILHCGKCRKAKEHIVSIPGRDGIKVRCLCECGIKTRDNEIAARRRMENQIRMDRMRSIGMWDASQRKATFSNADGRNADSLAACKRYCDNWEDMQRENAGLLIWGGVGAGKSYAAACIANEIMDAHNTEVMMTNFLRVRDGLWSAEDKTSYIDSLVQYPLLILDDFGVERNTEFAMEQVYQVINARYRTQRPLIVTTNLTLQHMQEASPAKVDVMHQRIFSRILEMCIPFQFGGTDRRKDQAIAKRAMVKELINESRKGVTI